MDHFVGDAAACVASKPKKFSNVCAVRNYVGNEIGQFLYHLRYVFEPIARLLFFPLRTCVPLDQLSGFPMATVLHQNLFDLIRPP